MADDDELTFTATDGAFGAVAEGALLTEGSSTVDERRLRLALERHGVLVFRGSAIPAERFVALGRMLGELEILPEPDKRHPDHPEIFNLSNVRPDGQVVTFDEPQAVFLRGTERWHTDSSFRAVPCLCTMLNAITVPPEGGETEFADMTAAYEALPADRQDELSRLMVVHSYEYSRANNPGRMDPMSEEEQAKYPPVEHPLVRVNGDGRRSLYMGGHASHIVGMPVDDGRALLAELVEFAGKDRFVYRHRWQANDLVIWDNRSTLHRLRPYDIARYPRVMQRLTVAGTEPPVPAG
jgi:alpha-ketoglutarate-dependent taurine dioxygenase